MADAISTADSAACPKCGSNQFGFWTSSSGNFTRRYCRPCQAVRRQRYRQLKANNGGHHQPAEWRALLNRTPRCPDCQRGWAEIPARPNPRYRFTWTKDHIVPLSKDGNDAIGNVRPLCYECNFRKASKIPKDFKP